MQSPLCKICKQRHWPRDPHVLGKEPQKLTKAKPVSGMCAQCGKRPASQSHHVVHKGMGGRKGIEKKASDSQENRENLCQVCHDANYGIFPSVTNSTEPSATLSQEPDTLSRMGRPRHADPSPAAIRKRRQRERAK